MQSHPTREHRNRKILSYREVIAIYIRDRGCCALCHCTIDPKTVVLDHIIPLAAGGADRPENIQLACNQCNTQKGRKTPGHAVPVLRPRPRIWPAYQLLTIPPGKHSPQCVLIGTEEYCRAILNTIVTQSNANGHTGEWRFRGGGYRIKGGPQFRVATIRLTIRA